MNSKAKTDLMRKENIEDVFPMSDIQVGMMYHSLKDPQAAVYHGQGVYVEKVKDFDPGIFRKTIELLVEKHPMLRTGFNISDFKEPVQIVFKTVTPDLDHVDLTHMDQSQQEQYLRSYLAEDQALSFNLKVPAPLWRMSTFTLDQDTICFIWSRHHAVTDGWSAAALITELNNTYIKLKSNPHYVPRKLKNTYKQYVLEQRHLKKNKKTRAFWQKELDGYKRLNFPGVGGHESKDSQKNTYARDLGKELREQLNQMAAQYNISFKNLCFAAYIYMLGMLSYDGELVVGLVTNNRPICEDGDKIIGCFLNTVPVRILIPAQLKWQDYIRLVDKKLLELTNYNQLSLMEIVKCVNEETGGHNPIFDTLFNFVDFHIYSQINQVGIPENSSDKNERKVSAPGGELTNTLLDCSVLTTSGEFIITFNYKSSRLNRQLIENLAGYFEAVLKKFVHELQDIIDREELIPEIERRKLLYEFNKTDAEYPQNKTIQQLYAEQVGKAPDAIAFGADISITYKELNRRSNLLAYLLQEKGVKPDAIVAIMLENSIELIISILGILQAGGAYLPIDPDYPRERIRYMLADSRVNILVKNSRGVDNPAIEHQLFVLDFQHLNFEFVSNFLIRISDLNASNLSYIIYTSGSTGKPKGTLIENRNVVRLLFNDQFQFDFSSSDVWTLFHSCCFDFSVWEMYGALLYGGKLILIPKMLARNPDDFRELLKQEAVTVLNQTPAAFYHLANLETKIPGKDLKLRYVIFGGEPLAPARLKEWKEKYPGTKLINMYGITETTVHVTYKEIELEDIRLSISNIGKPIPTLSAYVVDRNQKLVPIGVAGELCVGGQGVCRGYLNRPQLTAEKFCLRQPGGALFEKNFLLRGLAPLLYRSGDLVRRLENGEMEYLGRVDQQVKVRGYRIEPGEIEKQLLNHDEINEAVVTARKNTSANQWELIAYIVSPRSFETPELRDYLSGHLPDYMIPSYFLHLETIPLTPNGKIDRKTLALQGKELNSGVDYAPPQGELEKTVANIWMEILGVKKIGIDENFFDIGGDSLRAVQLSSKLNTVLSTDISIVELFEYVTIRSFVRYLQEKQGKKGTSQNNMNRSAVVRPGQEPQKEQDRPKSMGIAVIGMSGKFPGAKNIQEFWDNLKNGVEAISFLSGQELQDARVDPVVLTDPNYVKTSGAIFTAREYFDAAFFEYTPMEAGLLNPQVRVFHECVWEALEDAGYVPDSYQGSIGIYAGATTSFHWEGITLLSGKTEELGLFTGSLLANKDYLSTRIAYRFNLSGPAVTVNTACSTSLVAVHLACRAIWAGECDMALAGGACIVSRPLTGYHYQQGMIASRDGHCRAFDANASGTASGNGAGVVVLKPLANAIADRDHIYAVIKGTAINNDGITKSNFTAPSRKAQTKVIQMAHQDAGVTAESIGYVEAHGTGTPIGDPIEVAALCQAFATNRNTPCAIGSVKTNIGHLDAAAGIAGLIKTILSLKHRLIPPSLHYEKPNPKINFENTPFYVNTTLSPWETNKKTRRAGVSAFGLGGTNAHVVLEEAPPAGESVNQWVSESVGQHVSDSVGQLGKGQGTVSRGGSLCPPPETGSREYQLILLSAKTPSALQRMTENLGEYLKKNPGINLADMAYTLDLGRKVWPHRRLLVCSTVEETIAALTSPGSALLHTRHRKPGDKDRAIIFMFPGQGSQFVDMGLELYRSETLFREHMDRCFKILKPLMGQDIRDILYPFSRSHRSDKSDKTYRSDINQTEIAQPVLFAFEYALAKLLMTWGITPDAMIGHSIGEYVAAHLSGVFSLEDGLKLAAARGRLMQQMLSGAMLSVPLPEQQLIPLLNQQLSLAAVNGPDLCVVSGPLQAVTSFEKQMEKQGYDCRRLHTSHAFHSTMMEPILAEFKKEVARVTRNKPKIPYISGLSGNWITAAQAADPGYWARHLRETVRFNRGLEKLFNWKQCLCLELGPGNVLSSLVKRFTQQQPDQKTIHFVRHPQEKVSDLRFLLNKIGELWFYGKPVHWSGFYAQQERHRLPLPTYPFQGQRYWIDEASLPVTPEAWARRSLSKKKQDIAAWFYFPLWKQSGPDFSFDNGSKSPDQLRWLVFTDNLGLGKRLQELLRQKKQRIISVTAGEAFTRINHTEYMIDPGQANHYISLFSQLLSAGDIPNIILHLWNVTGTSTRDYSVEWVKQAQDYGYFSLLYQAQAIGKLNISDKIQIMMVTDNMQEVTGEEDLCPEKATLLGPAKVVPQEYRNISCRCIDITCPKNGNWPDTALTDRLLTEFQTLSPDTIVAYRGNYRWIQIYEPLTGEKTQNHREIGNQLRNKGVYLIIGGLGGVGRVWARYLAASVKARLVLTGRSAFPLRSRWEQWISTHPKNHRTSRQIRAIQELEKMGAAVLVMQADAADPKQMHQVLHRAEETFGPLNGVIHCAGIIGEKTVQAVGNTDRSHTMTQFYPKVDGLLVLEKILRDKSLDFCLQMSSLASVLGGLGFTAYTAANTFIDSFVRRHNQSNPIRWTSINWDAWEFRPPEKISAANKKNTHEFFILPEEGTKAFRYILSWRNTSQIVISTGDLQTRINQWLTFETEDEEPEPREAPPASGYGREHLSTTYLAPGNPLQQEIVHLWQKFFGIHPIGINDDFFQLGGDSLTAVTIARKLHRHLNVVVPLAEFFNRSTIKELAQYIQHAERKTYSTINPVEKKEYHVLSSAQKRLYILQQMESKSIAYNQYHVALLEGKPDREKLQHTFKALIQRHETLRSAIFMVSAKPVQKVYDEVEFVIDDYKPKNLKLPWSESCLPALARDFVRPFDLSHPPLFRVGLIKIGNQQHILVIDMHHLVTDGVSFGIFVKELGAIYGGQVLQSLKLQYKDYSEWQNTQKQQEFINNQGKYWLDRFQEEIPVLHLPTDYPRPVVQSFEGNSLKFEINGQEAEKLKKLGQKQDATLFMVTLALVYIFLAKLSGQEDIVIGSPVACRRHLDLQYIMGIFINTLALRDKPNGKKTFQTFLKEVKENALKAFENQEYPFEDLIDIAEVDRDISRNPLFDIMFVLQNVEIEAGMIPEVRVPDLKWKFLEFENKHAKFDLTLTAVETREKLVFELQYCTKLFKKETIQRYITYFKQLAASLSETPENRISDIDMVPPEEKQQLLETFSSGIEVLYPKDKPLYRLFEEQVEKTPDHTALVGQIPNKAASSGQILNAFGKAISITYKELNQKANQLAYLLKEKGVKPDTIVGLMIERSIEMMIGVWGILKSGAAYLPIDPDYPRERIQYMLTDSKAKFFVTAANLSETFEKLSIVNCQLLMVSNKPPGRRLNTPPKEASSHLHLAPAPVTSLAYIIYTSGSTGRPKGTPIDYGNVNNYTGWFKKEFDITGEDRFAFTGSFCFDMSVTSLLVPLVSGASLWTTRDKIERDPWVYTCYLSRSKISIIKLTPTQFKPLLDLMEEIDLGSLRYIILGGEAVDVKDVQVYLSCYSRQSIVNEYGPTEATVATVFYVAAGSDVQPTRAGLPIGRPIFNTRVYILDRYAAPVPIGVAGELYIGGQSVSRGYLNNPELTSEKFCLRRPGERFLKKLPPWTPRKNFLLKIAPLSSEFYPGPCAPGFRLYKSGDLVRWLPDGNIEYLGRIDTQIKIKGYRIELEEIEAVLTAHEGVHAGVVAGKKDPRGNLTLVGFIILKHGATTIGVKEYLKQRLPAYMVPALVAAVEELPLAVSGKIDRKKLPDLSDLQLTGSEAFRETALPSGEKEKLLVDTWKQVLGVPHAGVHHHFFELGGDSIKAIQVAARLRKARFQLAVNDIFLHPYIKELKKYLKKIDRSIDQGIVTGEVVLTPVQRWFFERYYSSDNNDFTALHHFNQSVMIYREGGFDCKAVEQVFTQILFHHDALRMVYPLKNGTVRQWNKAMEGKPFHLETIDLRGIDTGFEIEIEAAASGIQKEIDLANGPLVRLGLFKTNQGDHLLIVIHHLVVDGVSWRILQEDFALGYQQVINHQPVTFQEKTDSFQYWAMKLKEYAGSAQALKELEYWKTIKDTKNQRLPTDHAISPHQKQRRHRNTITMTLPGEDTEKLLRQVNRAYNTEINDILLAALGLALKDWVGIHRVLINLEGHGREEILPEVSINRTVGWFTTRFPVALDLNCTAGLSYFIKLVKETLRKIPHRGIGYGILRYLTEEKPEDIAVEPPISFNYLGEFGQESDSKSAAFEFSWLKTGNPVNPQLKESHQLDINGMVTGGRLVLSFDYNKYEYEGPTIDQLVESYGANLREIIRHCTGKQQVELTPSDLDYQVFTIDELSAFENKIRETAGEIENIYRLSPMQSGMFYHYLANEDAYLYFEQYEISLQGEIDGDLLEKSLNLLLLRYDVLRTIFVQEGCPEPLQIVMKQRYAPVHFVDISNLTGKSLNNYIESLKQEDRDRGFDLASDVLIRTVLIKTGSDSYKVIWSFHHIIMDGWCIGIIFKDLVNIYVSLRENRPIQLETATPYNEYLKWLHGWSKKNARETWKEYLEGYEQPIGLPKYSDPDKNVEYRMEKYQFVVDKELTAHLVMLANENQVTINTIMQTLWGILLQKLNQVTDVIFGQVVSGRPPIEDVEHMVGLFINTIPIRIKLEKEIKTFCQLARHVQQQALLIQSHQYLPLAEIESCSPLKNKLSDHIMIFENYPVQEELGIFTSTNPSGFEIVDVEVFEQTNYHFNLIVVPGKAISITFFYNSRVYDSHSIKKTAFYFKEIIKQVKASGNIEVKDIQLIGHEPKSPGEVQLLDAAILEEARGEFGF